MTSKNKPRTRFAPSPTGFMHVGNVRTALFAWLLAKHGQGTFILRIEDTDKKREVSGSIDYTIKTLRWLGIDWQEGIEIGGPNTPYKQSERLDIYRKWADKLVAAGRAYADPYTPEEVKTFREQSIEAKKPFLYRDYRPNNPPEWDGKTSLRFKSDPKNYSWHDMVMGDLSAGADAIDDFVLMKSDGYPTYNFCHIIDDYLMKVTHVLRSQEFISSTPKFINLHEALGIKPPIFATLPYVMAIDGKKKLSKRDGAKDILQYAKEGYLPEALLNFLATLGWNDGTEQEVFAVEELIDKFSLDRVQRSPARFDESRLLWLNGQWIRRISVDELYDRTQDFWSENAQKVDPTYKKHILELVQDRLKTLSDIPAITSYFFSEPTVDLAMIARDKKLKKLSYEELEGLLQTTLASLSTNSFTPTALQDNLNALLEETGQKPAVLFSLIRLAVSWAPFSPALNDTLSVLGRERVLGRLQKTIDSLSK